MFEAWEDIDISFGSELEERLSPEHVRDERWAYWTDKVQRALHVGVVNSWNEKADIREKALPLLRRNYRILRKLCRKTSGKTLEKFRHFAGNTKMRIKCIQNYLVYKIAPPSRDSSEEEREGYRYFNSRRGNPPISDEEYAAGLKKLGIESEAA